MTASITRVEIGIVGVSGRRAGGEAAARDFVEAHLLAW
jgi:hypothetical protein